MEQIQNFIPVAFVILISISGLLSPIFYFRLRRAKKKELATAKKAEQDIAQLQEDCAVRLSEALADAERKAETAQAEHSKALERYAAIVDIEVEVERLRTLGQNQVDESQSKVSKLNGEARATQDNIRELQQSYKEKRVMSNVSARWTDLSI